MNVFLFLLVSIFYTNTLKLHTFSSSVHADGSWESPHVVDYDDGGNEES